MYLQIGSDDTALVAPIAVAQESLVEFACRQARQFVGEIERTRFGGERPSSVYLV